jgi:hypothetical protein
MAMTAKERLRAAGARLRATGEDKKEMGALALTAAGIGYLERSGRMASVPKLLGLPRTATLAIAGYVGEKYAPASLRPALAGVKNGAAAIAIYQFARTFDISQVSGHRDDDDELAAAQRLEEGIAQRRLAERTDADRELDELEREARAPRARARASV